MKGSTAQLESSHTKALPCTAYLINMHLPYVYAPALYNCTCLMQNHLQFFEVHLLILCAPALHKCTCLVYMHQPYVNAPALRKWTDLMQMHLLHQQELQVVSHLPYAESPAFLMSAPAYFECTCLMCLHQPYANAPAS